MHLHHESAWNVERNLLHVRKHLKALLSA